MVDNELFILVDIVRYPFFVFAFSMISIASSIVVALDLIKSIIISKYLSS
nr:MAG TPA: hypothetical protein [Caudoviricetes sp.]